MALIKKVKQAIKKPTLAFAWLSAHGFLNWMSDKAYLRLAYRIHLKKRLNLKSPQTYNEKLQWLKLYDRNPSYTTMVDKYEVRDYIASHIGEQYLIPLVGGPWNRFEEIDFDALPNQFVLKTTHDSGGVFICRQKDQLDIGKAKEFLNKSLKRNFFWRGREWPYKNCQPRIIAEKFMEDADTAELRDYKFFAFDGEVKALFIASERQNKNTETKFDFFDAEYHHLDFKNGHPNAEILPDKPQNFEQMKLLAAKLSKGLPHVRVDFYEVNGKIYFGEITFFHWSGLVPFEPAEWDKKFGDWIDLPNINK